MFCCNMLKESMFKVSINFLMYLNVSADAVDLAVQMYGGINSFIRLKTETLSWVTFDVENRGKVNS